MKIAIDKGKQMKRVTVEEALDYLDNPKPDTHVIFVSKHLYKELAKHPDVEDLCINGVSDSLYYNDIHISIGDHNEIAMRIEEANDTRLDGIIDTENITRVEIIDEHGRSYVKMNIEDLEISLQDGNKTLKLFVNTGKEIK